MPRPIPNILDAFATQGWALHERFLDSAIEVLDRRNAVGADLDALAAALEAKAARASAERTPSKLSASPLASQVKAAGGDVTVVRDPDSDADQRGGFDSQAGEVGDELYTLFAPPGGRMGSGVAVVPIRGVLAQRASMINGMSQPDGMSYGRAAKAVLAAAADPRVAMDRSGRRGKILLDIDSPGGTVAGVDTLLSAIRRVRAGGTEVHAYAGDMAASAAYWVACCCETVTGPMQATVGSVGVYCVVTDSSGMDRKGVKKILVASGPAKGAGADGAPVTPVQLSYIAREILTLAAGFAGDVRAARNLSDEQMSEVATGAAFAGPDAVALGLLDATRSFDDVVSALVESL